MLFAFIALVMLAIYMVRGPVGPLIACGLFVSSTKQKARPPLRKTAPH